MPNSVGRTRSSGGFTLLELLVLVVLIVLSSVWGLPRALEPRLVQNERMAVELLRMIRASRQAWEARFGLPPTLAELAGPLQSPSRPAPSRGLLPASALADGDGAILRGGYRFQERNGASGAALGCWAWPKLPGYSGRSVLWLDYDDQTIQEIVGIEGTPPPGAPALRARRPLATD